MSNKVIPEHASALSVFDNIKRTKLVFGDGVSLASGELAKELGLKHVLLVTDRGLVEAGHVEVVRDSLSKAGIKVTLFDQVIENPTTDCVEKAKQAASEARVDSFIGLGGGSSMDTAKGANFLLTNGGRMHDYWGVNKATKEMLPLIVIPRQVVPEVNANLLLLFLIQKLTRRWRAAIPRQLLKLLYSIPD